MADPQNECMLKIPRESFREQLVAQIASGNQLISSRIESQEGLDTAWSEYRKWIDYTAHMLRKRFTTSQEANAFGGYNRPMISGWAGLEGDVANFRSGLGDSVTSLESLESRLEFIDYANDPEVLALQVSVKSESTIASSSAVFLVHGHNEEAKNEVEVFLRTLEL